MMIILTCVSDNSNEGYLLGLKSSCTYYKLNLETIVHEGVWSGHRLKDKYIEKFLSKLNPQEIILFVDGYDSVLVSDEKEILKKYHALDSPVVFSAEINCYPYNTFAYLYQERCKFKYLNSGGYIGTAGDILKLYKSLELIDLRRPLLSDQQYYWSNQYHWMKLYLYSTNCIKLDTECVLFQTFANNMYFKPDLSDDCVLGDKRKSELKELDIKLILADFEFREHRIFNRITNSNPCHLHFNSVYLKDFMFLPLVDSVLPWINEYPLK